MFVFGLKIEEFEYAFQLDGPYDEKKGLLFKKENVLLDPYARAVTGQRNWGERPEGGADFIYHARVVENNFDWGDIRPTEHPFEYYSPSNYTGALRLPLWCFPSHQTQKSASARLHSLPDPSNTGSSGAVPHKCLLPPV